MTVQNKKEEPKLKKIVDAADGLSLGISMVVAVLIGVAIGLGLRNLTGAGWTLWIGVFIGVGAAVLNVYKAYDKQKRSLGELADDPRYTYKKEQQEKYDAEDEDDKY
jgi:F0F1-type ATP synthase assembly protein I